MSKRYSIFKSAYKKRPKALALVIFLLVFLAILHMFSVWQLDLILEEPVWNTQKFIEEVNGTIYAKCPFKCWLWIGTIGEAYDTLFFINFISYFGTVILFVYLFYLLMKYGTENREEICHHTVR